MDNVEKVMNRTKKCLGIVCGVTLVKILSLLVGFGLIICSVSEFVGIIVLATQKFDWMVVVSIIFSLGYILCYMVGGVSAILSSIHIKHIKRDRIFSILFLFSVICVFLLYGTETTLALATNETGKQVDEEYEKSDPEVQDSVAKSSIYAISYLTIIFWVFCNLTCLCCYFCVASCNIMTILKRSKKQKKSGEIYRPLEEAGEEEEEMMEDAMNDDRELPEFEKDDDKNEFDIKRNNDNNNNDDDDDNLKKDGYEEQNIDDAKEELFRGADNGEEDEVNLKTENNL